MTKVDKYLTEKEKLDDIRLDCTKYCDFILDNGYTGVVEGSHAEDLISSLKVKFVSNRILYMNEFKKGLDVYGLGDMIMKNPDACRSLYVKKFCADMVPDADYLFTLVEPVFSEEGSSR